MHVLGSLSIFMEQMMMLVERKIKNSTAEELSF